MVGRKGQKEQGKGRLQGKQPQKGGVNVSKTLLKPTLILRSPGTPTPFLSSAQPSHTPTSKAHKNTHGGQHTQRPTLSTLVTVEGKGGWWM